MFPAPTSAQVHRPLPALPSPAAVRPPILVPVRRPLLPLAACAVLLGLPHWKIQRLVEDGRLQFAFNIATPGARTRALRVLTKSVRDFLANPGALRSETADELTAELNGLFPPLCLTYSSTAVEAVLGCSHQHVKRLVLAGLLAQTKPGTTGRAAILSRKACVEFLRSRRIQ